MVLFRFFLFVCLINQLLSQTQQDIFDFLVRRNSDKCVNIFDNKWSWTPDNKFCNGCTSSQICRINFESDDEESECYELSDDCVDAIKDHYGYGETEQSTTVRNDRNPDVTTEESEYDTTIDDSDTETTQRQTTERPTEGTTKTSQPTVKPAEKQDGQDQHPMCCKWALKGACGYNPQFMRVNCQKSCGTVGCQKKNADNCQVNVNVNPLECRYLFGNNQKPKPYIPPLYVGNRNGQCSDRHRRCSYWASIGECSRNDYWMKTRCQRSCNCCGCTTASLAGLSYSQYCNDIWEQCPFWASKGECLKNQNYMHRKCRASCGLC